MSWWKNNLRIAREGIPFLLGAAGIALAVIVLVPSPAGLLSLAIPLYVAWFFRDPSRIPPPDDPRVLFSGVRLFIIWPGNWGE